MNTEDKPLTDRKFDSRIYDVCRHLGRIDATLTAIVIILFLWFLVSVAGFVITATSK